MCVCVCVCCRTVKLAGCEYFKREMSFNRKRLLNGVIHIIIFLLLLFYTCFFFFFFLTKLHLYTQSYVLCTRVCTYIYVHACTYTWMCTVARMGQTIQNCESNRYFFNFLLKTLHQRIGRYTYINIHNSKSIK